MNRICVTDCLLEQSEKVSILKILFRIKSGISKLLALFSWVIKFEKLSTKSDAEHKK